PQVQYLLIINRTVFDCALFFCALLPVLFFIDFSFKKKRSPIFGFTPLTARRCGFYIGFFTETR
ncbi:MAG: hypothetical protein IKE28_05070, partial [Solobacterium sp.]|nr:hypothetical protein [Solobacterium sp.]